MPKADIVGSAATAVAYFLSAWLGKELEFPSAPVSALWAPNAILFAALVLAPVGRWWIYLLAVLPLHIIAQMGGTPAPQVAIQYVMNCAEAVLGAAALIWLVPYPRSFSKLATAVNLILCGSILSPLITSVGMAAAFTAVGIPHDFSLTVIARTATNTFAILTLVPLIVRGASWLQGERTPLSMNRVSEALILTITLLAVSVFVFVTPVAEGPAWLYAPLPFLLWATVRFGTTGACASVLLLGACSTWGVLHGHGPFTDQHPVSNALSLVLFLVATCTPLLVLAALLHERRESEAALSASEAKFRSIFENNMMPTVTWLCDGRISDANDAFLRLVGRLRADVISGQLRWDALLPHTHRRQIEKAREEVVQTGRFTPFETALTLADGRELPVIIGGCHLPGESQRGVGYAFDLSETRRADAARRHVTALHEAVLASLTDQVAVLDRDGTVLEVNSSWRRAVENAMVPVDGALPGENYLESCSGAAQRGDGAAAEVVGALEMVLSGSCPRRQLEFEVGGNIEPRWFEECIEPLRRPEGGVVLTLTDITARKRAELEAIEQRYELAHLGRVATLGELSGAIAHELNQPLTAILGNVEAAQRLIERTPINLPAIREILKDIVEDDVRAGEVIQRLRTLLRKGEMQRLPFDLNEVTAEVLALLRSGLISRRVTVERRLTPNLQFVAGDRVQIQQVILNLLSNAFEAMEETPVAQRRVVIATRQIPGGQQIELLVADRGGGIADAQLERIFQPFVSTKANGLGLGLAICRSIIKAHGGRLWAENSPEGGAIMHFTLPRYG